MAVADLVDKLRTDLEAELRPTIRAEIEKEIAAKATPPKPIERTGILTNVRFGIVPGEDDEASLRGDVNCDGSWVLARASGRHLDRLLADNGVTDIMALESRTVRVTSDTVLGWRLTGLLTEKQAQDYHERVNPIEVPHIVTPQGQYRKGHRFRGSASGSLYVLKADGNLEVIEPGPKATQGAGHALKFTSGVAVTPVAPIIEDSYGNPLYVGDRVKFTGGGQHDPTPGTITHYDGSRWLTVKRDDKATGNGFENGWQIDLTSKSESHYYKLSFEKLERISA